MKKKNLKIKSNTLFVYRSKKQLTALDTTPTTSGVPTTSAIIF